MYLRFFFLFFIACFLGGKAQEGYSKKQLLEVIAKPAADTTLIDAYNDLSWPVYSYDLPDSAIFYAEKAIALSTKINDVMRLSIAHRRLGITYSNTGDIKQSIQHQEESYKLSEKINFKRGMQISLNNIGVAYMNNDLLNKALSYFLQSLKIVEETKDYSRVDNLYFNCGMIYKRSGDLVKAKSYFLKSKHYAQIYDPASIVSIDCSISALYRGQNLLDSAKLFLDEARKGITDKTNTATKYNYYLNEGLLLSVNNEHEKALAAFLNSVKLATNASDEVIVYSNVAEEYKKLNDPEKTGYYFKKAYEVSKENKLYNNLQYISFELANYYKSEKNDKNYAMMMNEHLNYRDSNDKYSRVQQLQQQQLEFDYERKHVADSIKFQHKENITNMQLAIAEANLTKEKYFKMMLLVILAVIVIFSIFILNRFMLTNRQKKIIEHQKLIVEEKNREMLDSINYAKRLQQAILPQVNDIKKELQFDILYLPKDIIGGDFYFFEKHGDNIFLGVCDCTGHGIPGAMMSVVCHQALRKSIKEFDLIEPHLVLEKTRQIIIESLNATLQNIQDGMDCSLLVINTKDKKMSWAGAYHPIWILSGDNITEITGDKQPVALYEKAKEFSKHELELPTDSLVYLFTDGFADQFGGDKGKKYKQKQLREFLISVSKFSLEEQISLLSLNFTSWKGPLDQVDDVTVAVFKV